MTSAERRARVGVFGGSGFYAFLDGIDRVELQTPYGDPSAAVSIGEVAGTPVAFLPRHGEQHQFPPHLVNWRANLWAMRALGVSRVVGPCAAGSLKPTIHPGEFVVLDQLVDRTSGRPHTFYDGPVPHLARELGICYTGIALITDYDTGVEDEPGVEPVTMEQVFRFLDSNVEAVRSVLFDLIPKIPEQRAAGACADALGPPPD